MKVLVEVLKTVLSSNFYCSDFSRGEFHVKHKNGHVELYIILDGLMELPMALMELPMVLMELPLALRSIHWP